MIALRETALSDLYFLCKYILGMWWLCWEPHKEFCEEVQRDIHLALFLLPRGHCKTMIFNTGHTLQCYLKEPEQSIAVFCDIQKRASWKLRPIKSQLERNQALKELFPDLLYQNPKRESVTGNQEEIILPGHRGQQEPSIGMYGLDNQPTSLHFPRIKGDDLVTDKTTTTADQIKKNIDQFGLARSSILYPTGGNLQVCGTIYDDGDLHRQMEDSGIYKVYKRPAEWTEIDEDGIKHRRVLWPVQYGAARLDEIKKDPSVSVYIYSCNYLLDPAPEDDNAFFQLKWFPRYRRLPAKLKMFAAADLAISEAESACDTAIVVGGIDEHGDLFLVHVRKGHWGPLEILDNLIEVQVLYHPAKFTIEAENIAKTIKPFLSLKQRETQIFGNFDYWSPQGRGDKVLKARPLQGRAKEGAVWLPDKGGNAPDWLFDAEYQIRKFPRAKDKDVLDSFALLCMTLDKQYRPPTQEEIYNAANDEYVPLEPGVGM